MIKRRILEIKNDCTGCGACASICPKKCLHIEPDSFGYYYPTFKPDQCIDCGLCEKACHILTPVTTSAITQDEFYIYHANSDDVREASSSGGAFSMFADYVLKQGGVVFGSRYNGDKERLEVSSTDECSIVDLRKSKYIESYVGLSFASVRQHLLVNRMVLFCGTPCQIRGLKRYLTTTRTSQKQLITLDFVCHGVPSNQFFTEFKHMHEELGKRVVKVDTRYKDFSKNLNWHTMSLALTFQDGSKKIIMPSNYYYYYYYQPFMDNLILRESCYSCTRVCDSSADFTIGDFWGVHKYRRELDDNKGLSFIKIHNMALKPLLMQLASIGFIEPMPYAPNERQYQQHKESEIPLKLRNHFLSQCKKMGYLRAVEQYYHLTPFKKLQLSILDRLKSLKRKIN